MLGTLGLMGDDALLGLRECGGALMRKRGRLRWSFPLSDLLCSGPYQFFHVFVGVPCGALRSVRYDLIDDLGASLAFQLNTSNECWWMTHRSGMFPNLPLAHVAIKGRFFAHRRVHAMFRFRLV